MSDNPDTQVDHPKGKPSGHPNYGKLANLDVDAAIEAIANGSISAKIARAYGVTPYAIRKRLAKHPDYVDAMACQAHSFVESAMEELMECDLDQVAIARARAKVDGALRYARAHNPDYADKSQLNVAIIDLSSAIAEARLRSVAVQATEQQAQVIDSQDNSRLPE